MSEKRFRANFDVSIYDSETEEYISVSERGLEEIAERMNEQQDQIHRDELSIKTMLTNMEKLEKENEALKKFIKDNFNEMMDSKMVIDDE